MPNFNKVIIAGNLCRDPELRYTPKGTALVQLSVAINRQWTAENGEKKEEVTFVDTTAFGKTAETISKYLKKGRPILIEGRLRQESWDDKQTGQKRSKLSVMIESFQFLGSSQDKPAGAARTTSAPSAPASSEPEAGDAPPETDDSVPF